VKDLPIWIFHGGKDGVVPTDLSRKMADRMKEIGGKTKYTEYPGVGHNSWSLALEEADLADWLFSQRRP
jgi:predicted peptidase